MLRKSTVAPLLAAPLLLLFAIFFVVPFVEIMRISFSGKGGAWAGATWLMSSPVFAVVFLSTLKLALSVTLICLVLGYPAACFIAGQPASFRSTSCISPEIIVLSIPPDRNAPSGTSLRSRSRTASVSRRRSSRRHSSDDQRAAAAGSIVSPSPDPPTLSNGGDQ